MNTSAESSQRKERLVPSVDTLQRLAISESGFVFDPVSGHSFSVNETGMKVIRLLQRGLDLRATVDTLGEEYSGGVDVMERDLIEFLGLLREQVDISE
jgi:hypothetical protein